MSLSAIESYLQETIFPELDKGRLDWDKPHTIAVVKYIKKIIAHNENMNLDKLVLVIAAYAHDWGYSGLFHEGKPREFDKVMNAKTAHMQIGADKLKRLFKNEIFDALTPEQKNRAIYLVKIHDNFSKIVDADARILLEADTLGALEIDKIKPLDADSNERWMRGVRKRRFPLFITEYSKNKYDELSKT